MRGGGLGTGRRTARAAGLGAIAALLLSACGGEVARRDDLHVGTLVDARMGPRARDAAEDGAVALEIGRPGAALAHYTAAAGHAGLTPDVALGLARANIGLGRLNQAEALLRPVAAARQDAAEVQSEYGRLLLRLDRPADASRVLRLAFALNPEDTLVQAALTESLARMDSMGYADDNENAFILGHEGGGLYTLSPPS